MPDMTHPAAKAIADAITNPGNYQPPSDEAGDSGNVGHTEPTGGETTGGEPASGEPKSNQDNSNPDSGKTTGEVKEEPKVEPTPTKDLTSLSLEEVLSHLKTLAGETGISKEEAMAADINAAMAKARHQEKDKLYGQISTLKSDLQAAQALNTQLTEATKSLADQVKEFQTSDGKKKKNDGDSTSPSGLTEESLNKAIEVAVDRTATAFQEQIDALRAENQALQNSQKASSVESYKRQLLEANKGAIIEEMVTGDTPEALDESLILAKQTYARIAARLTPTTAEPATPAVSDSPTTPTSPKLPPTPVVNQQTPSPTGSVPLTMESFSENREKLLKEASAAVKNALGGINS